MKIFLTLADNCIDVTCEIKSVPNNLSFTLASDMSILEMKDEQGESVPYHTSDGDIGLSLPISVKKYDIEKDVKALTVRYSGTISGTFAYFEHNIIHFSFYNAWYPMNRERNFTYDIYLHMDLSWNVLNAENVRFCCESCYQSLMKDYIEYYRSLYDFYVDLYGIDRIGTQDIVFLPERDGWRGDGYRRPGLIALAKDPGEVDWIKHLLAHEVGHSYGFGADFSTWED